MGERALDAERIVVHPEVPALAKVFVAAPDTVFWFSRSTPPTLLRADTTIVEPGDPHIRIELVGRP